MAGIIALIGNFNINLANQMLTKLYHRGPDKIEILSCDNEKFLLGERKLNYELTRENKYNQANSSGTEDNLRLVIDGEPRKDGAALSRFELTQMLNSHGPDFISHLGNGFVIIYTDGKHLFAARDIFGKKPLYYGFDSYQNMYFASEMKALTGIISEVHVFPPGHYYSTESGFKKFESIPHFQTNIDNESHTKDYFEKAAELKYLLTKAVADNWRKGKHPAVFLSGGIDSSVVAAALANLTTDKIHTFAVGMENSKDILNARKVSEFLQTEHIEKSYNVDDMFQVLSEVIYHLESFDVELVNSSIANYLVSQLTREYGFDIALSGEGADELFGGYHHLKDCTTDNQLNKALEELLTGLHNGGLQRVDRMTNAHSLNCRMPFLHTELINFALDIPCHWKISTEGTEKLILRHAFDGDLPPEVLWRKKAQFGIGSGNEQAMKNTINKEISDSEYHTAIEKHKFKFKSKEEYFYYKIFKKFFPQSSMVKTVNRWLV